MISFIGFTFYIDIYVEKEEKEEKLTRIKDVKDKALQEMNDKSSILKYWM